MVYNQVWSSLGTKDPVKSISAKHWWLLTLVYKFVHGINKFPVLLSICLGCNVCIRTIEYSSVIAALCFYQIF
jgi:hypothetical protein